ncbi:MAG: sulfatase-like hydrolase/transferase, partial [Alphaproteobacteria bacterium]
MAAVKNVLFIMTDQQRWDYLGVMGHPVLETPALDALAARGVTFSHSYCQSPICGASRMCTYTGRYMTTHGAVWNNIPRSVAEWTIGDHLRPLGVRTALVGKTHMAADAAGMARLGVERGSPLGVLLSECGFEPFERDDGLHPTESADPNLAYNAYLRDLGYGGDNPWHDWANAAEGPSGEI